MEAAIRTQDWKAVVEHARQGALLSDGLPAQVAYFRSFVCVGNLFRHRYREALQAGLAAREAAFTSRNLRMLARAEYCLMRVYRILGNIELSHQAGSEMLAALEREHGSRTIEYRSFFAHVIAGMGRRQEAIDQLLMVIREADDTPLPARADRMFVRRLESAKADALEQIGLILLRSGDLNRSEEYLVHAFRIRKLLDAAKLNWSYNSLGELRMAQGRPAEAASLWTKSVSDRSSGLESWFPLASRAKANLALGRKAQALDDLLAALRSVRDLRLHLPLGDDIQVESEVSLQAIFTLAVRTAAEMGNADLAFSIASESRAYSLRARSAAGSEWSSRLPARYWDVLQALRRAETGAGAAASASLRRQLAEMESAAGLASQPFVPSQLSWQTVARSLSGGDRFTFFYMLDRKSLRWTVESNRLRLDWIEGKPAISDAARAFTETVRENRPSHREAGRRLYDAIFRGYDPLPAGAVWTILPDEELFQVPLAAMTNPATGRYLAEETALRFAAGMTETSGPAKASNGRFTAFADPIGNRADPRWNPGMRWWNRLGLPSHGKGIEFPRLFGSLTEAERCARVWGENRSQVLAGSELMQPGILSERASVLHFATHVFHPGGESSSSPLIFLGLSDRGELVTLSDAEIEVSRAAPELVTLSGCGSGTGRLAAGAGLLGLTRAWLMAGSEAVVASLWAVPDGSGALFEGYYRCLRGSRVMNSRQAALCLAEAQSAASGSSRVSVWGAYFVISLLGNGAS
jgi:tetratricopeptide (TPR) repeat protein